MKFSVEIARHYRWCLDRHHVLVLKMFNEGSLTSEERAELDEVRREMSRIEEPRLPGTGAPRNDAPDGEKQDG